MHIFFTSVLAGAAIWASTVLGIALPLNGATTGSAPSLYTSLSPFAQVNNKASLLFAWELVGGAPNQTLLHALCANFSQVSGTWAAEGLNTTLIKEVIDSADDSPPAPSAALGHVLFYITEIFVAQVLNVAPGNTGFLTAMCNDLNAQLLTSASLNATRVQTVICRAANATLPPDSPAGGSPETAIQINEDVSSLYGWQAVGITNSTEFLTDYCDNFQELSTNLAEMGLITGAIKQVICNQAKSPITPAEGKQQIISFSTSIFLQILLHVSEAEGYFTFLCSALNTTAMNEIGLDGQRISSHVCSLTPTK